LSDSKSLDFRLNFLGNLSGLSDGRHSLVVYVKAEGRYSPKYCTWENFKVGGSSPKTFFTVYTEIEDTVLSEEPKPFPTTLVMAPIFSVVIIGTALLVYLKISHKKVGVKA